MLGVAAGPGLAYGGLVVPWFAAAAEESAAYYVGVAAVCGGAGAMTLAAYVYWASFVDVLEAAYPYRSVDLGWAATATLWGAALQLAAAGLALVALCVFAAVRWRPDDGDAGDAAAFSAAATYLRRCRR